MKKYRKTSCLCAVLCLVMLFSLASCEKEQEPKKEKRIVGYQVLETGLFDGGAFGNHADEVELWKPQEIDDAFAPEELSIQFNGRTYTGIYHRTAVEFPDIHLLRYYAWEGGWFAVSKETGKLTKLFFADVGYKLGTAPTDEEAVAIAKELALGCGVDLSTYKASVAKSDKSYDFDYQITLFREVDGIRTNDSVYFELNRNGVLKYMSMGDVGSFEGVDTHGWDIPAVETAIEKKLNTIYQSNSHPRTQHSRKDVMLRWTDGSFALVTEIDLRFQAKDAAYYDEFVRLLVLPIYEEVTE